MKFNEIVSGYLKEDLSGLTLEDYLGKLETIVRILREKQSLTKELGMSKIGEYIVEIGNEIKTLK
jgi:hypothetical protein